MMGRLGWELRLGALPVAGGVRFRVWAPTASRVDVVVYGPDAERLHPLEPEEGGYHCATVPGLSGGARYRYRLEGGECYPDPASRSQPDGVHGPSEVVDPNAFRWTDSAWSGRDLEELVIYELHVGAFTPQGTFDAAAERLPEVAELGVTAIELMPVANFPGERNWGYDGVNLYAPATAYGGPEGLKRLVDVAHRHGLAVILDVVYNHLGPEGNYLQAVTGGRFFTDRHETPWGDGIDFDGEDSGPVRDLFIQNALYWLHEYHIDGFRLDATHAIVDDSPRHILVELAEQVHSLAGRHRFLIAEDERNERRLLLPREAGGFGLDAVWADDFHHQLRRLTAGDSEGYFAAFSGTTGDLAETLREGWWRNGSRLEVRSDSLPEHALPPGTPAEGIAPPRLVHCIQNHDQTGNRALGERLGEHVPPAVYRAASTLLLMSPYTPLLWMGQEWAASTPFLYFTDHPEDLGRLVTEGRREEFRHFSAFRDPAKRDGIPDPQAPETFERSKLQWDERATGQHAGVLALYRAMLQLRRVRPELRATGRESFRVAALGEGAVALRRRNGTGTALLAVANFRGESRFALADLPETRAPEGEVWRLLLASEEARFGGDGGWGRIEADGILHLMGPGAVVLSDSG
jgi:maltooligosyltrehalose trehalohydrolase